MSTYAVKDQDGTVLLRMISKSLRSQPTSYEDVAGMGLVETAEYLAKELGANTKQIASRMGFDTYLVLEKDDGEGDDVNGIQDQIDRARALRKASSEGTPEVPEVASEDGETIMKAGVITEVDDEKRIAFGWAYVTHDKDGVVSIDKSGDFVDAIEEIEKTAYDFVLSSRKGDAMHTNVHTTDMVESVVFTPEKIAKMGLAEGSMPLGWWVGFKVNDDGVWDRVKKGELRAFSVHGSGTRQKVDPDL